MGKANTKGKSIPISIDVDDTLNFNYNFEFKDLKKVKYASVINMLATLTSYFGLIV